MAQSTGKAGPFKIGVAMRTQVQPRWIFDVKSMEAEAKTLGDTLLVQWADDDQAKQQSQVENLVAQGINVLILAPVNDTQAPTLVEIAKKANIPVVAYDAPITNANIDYALTRDVYETGLWQADGCLKMFNPSKDKPINIALIKGDQDYVHAQIWNQAYHDKLDPLVKDGSVKIVTEQWHKAWEPALALKTAENTLTANNDNVQCFVTSNDGMAVGVSQAVKARNLTGKVYISGLDADIANLRNVLDGVQTMTIWTMIDVMGKRAVDAAHALAGNTKLEYDAKVNNGKQDVPTALIPVFAVTKDTMCEWLTKVSPPGWAAVDNVFESRPIPDACKKK
jgi:D-xylose transport system substrate-binding protein